MEAWLKKPEIPKPLAFLITYIFRRLKRILGFLILMKKKVNYLKDTTLE